MEKLLKTYTIVPSNLYVERSADRQVENIIDEMGRPGYVLVSRQMGKTNLLLNARRKFSNDRDRFVYVDLSNLFDDDLSCFQNIIDIAIETNLDVFVGLDLEIQNFRSSNKNLPPHKQHERELRILLNRISGKLIITLDEIDALTKTQYSDRIFSQIRSVYFARTNYEEFNRLTYILSGVVEPSELIKDPKISPFNIGEKIFLNDFSKNEYLEFIKKARLDFIDEKIKERVYYWTNGNPRLTWDLFSKIEEGIANIVEEKDVDQIVTNIYLTTFDKPPIDNIREIVKNDQHLRDALIEIEYGKGNIISDEIKQKLYLSGITNYSDGQVTIKNRIIKHSLSINWIESIGDTISDFFRKGMDFYNNSAYRPAIENLKRSLDHTSQNPIDENIAHFYLGLAYYYDYQFDNSKSELHLVEFNKKELGKLYTSLKLHQGYIHLIDKELNEAWDSFIEITEFGLKNEFYVSAKIHLVQIGISSNSEDKYNQSLQFLLEILNSDSYEYDLEGETELNEAKLIAAKLLPIDKLEEYSLKDQIKFLEDLTSKIHDNFKPYLFFTLYQVHSDIEKKSYYLESAVDIVLNQKLKINKPIHEFDIKFSIHQLRNIELQLFIENKLTRFPELIEYDASNRKGYNFEKTLDKLIGFAQNKNVSDTIIFSLAEYFYQNHLPTDLIIKRNLLLLLSNFSFKTEKNYVFELLELVTIEDSEVSLEILTLIIITINKALQTNDIDKIPSLISKFNGLEKRIPSDLKDLIIVIDYLELRYLKKIGRVADAKSKASQILNAIKSNNIRKTKNPIVSNNLNGIIDECTNTLNNLKNRIPVISHKLPGRNEIVTVKYNDGILITGKFKKIEKDYANGECIIIN